MYKKSNINDSATTCDKTIDSVETVSINYDEKANIKLIIIFCKAIYQ